MIHPSLQGGGDRGSERLVDLSKVTKLIKRAMGTSLVVQWLRFWVPNARGLGSIPGQGTKTHMPKLKIPHAQLRFGAAK